MVIFSGRIFFYLKNSINRQITGNLEPLKDFGINFVGSYHPLIYLDISQKIIKQGGEKTPPKNNYCHCRSEFYTDEDNSVNRSAMNVLRYSKKIITLLTVIVLFLFTFFNLGCTSYTPFHTIIENFYLYLLIFIERFPNCFRNWPRNIFQVKSRHRDWQTKLKCLSRLL